MASAFSTTSMVGPLAAPGSFATDRKSLRLSSFTSLSSRSLGGGKQKLHLQKRCNSKVSAMAKELYFNKDGSAIKKLQVSSMRNVFLLSSSCISLVSFV